MYNRYLNMALPEKQSAFLWGARKTGKSTYLKKAFPNSYRFNFLNTDLYFTFDKAPWLFREEVLSLSQKYLDHHIIVDEVQKVPAVMDEIHFMIEEHKLSFIMCGSSSRKMRAAGVNLLGGRAWKYSFFPLAYPEIKENFDLLTIFNNGLIPSHFEMKDATRSLNAYIIEYLASEIKAEGLVRNLASFNRFLESIAFCHGEMLNYSNIARDVGVSSMTVKEYYQVLEDTLIGYFVQPYYKKASRRTISSIPKFYLFDVGVANRIKKTRLETLNGAEAGKSLEHYIFLELLAYIKLNSLDQRIDYWRTHTGIEVDFILNCSTLNPIPVEVKISHNLHHTELKGLKTFMKEYNVKKGYLVCMVDRARKHTIEEGEIIIYPVKEFLEDLWDGKIFK